LILTNKEGDSFAGKKRKVTPNPLTFLCYQTLQNFMGFIIFQKKGCFPFKKRGATWSDAAAFISHEVPSKVLLVPD